MPQPSRLSVKDDRILAQYRDPEAAQALAERLPGNGRMVGSTVAFEAPAHMNLAQLTQLLQLEGPAADAAARPLQGAVIAAQTKQALAGFREVSGGETPERGDSFAHQAAQAMAKAVVQAR